METQGPEFSQGYATNPYPISIDIKAYSKRLVSVGFTEEQAEVLSEVQNTQSKYTDINANTKLSAHKESVSKDIVSSERLLSKNFEKFNTRLDSIDHEIRKMNHELEKTRMELDNNIAALRLELERKSEENKVMILDSKNEILKWTFSMFFVHAGLIIALFKFL